MTLMQGMDKILQPMPGEGARGNATVTNDGATILRSVATPCPLRPVLGSSRAPCSLGDNQEVSEYGFVYGSKR